MKNYTTKNGIMGLQKGIGNQGHNCGFLERSVKFPFNFDGEKKTFPNFKELSITQSKYIPFKGSKINL